MSTRILLLLLVTVGISSCVTPDIPTTGSLKVTVARADNSNLLKDVKVTLSPGGESLTTSSEGTVVFTDIALEGKGQGQEFTVTAEKAGFTTFTSDEVRVEPGKESTLTVSLTPRNDVFQVTPANIDFGNSIELRTLEIKNIGSEPLNWDASADVAWVGMSPQSGNVQHGGTSTVTVTVDRSVMPIGASNTSTITFSVTGTDNVPVPVLAANVPPNTPAQVATGNVIGAAGSTATAFGTITDLGSGGITQHGHCWATHTTPTTGDSRTMLGGINATGQFSSTLTGLAPGTTYHVRAYATNSGGTVYGQTVQFSVPALTVTDIDGNVYQTVTIGNQTWMASNLRTTKYRNGNPIEYVQCPWDWNSGGAVSEIQTQFMAAWGSASHDPQSGKHTYYSGYSASVLNVLGHLYNGHAVSDSRGVCPSGWRMPTSNDWVALFEFYGQGTAWSQIRSNSYWDCPGQTNSDLKLPGAGDILYLPYNVGQSSLYWGYNATTGLIVTVWPNCTNNYVDAVIADASGNNFRKSHGGCIRCIKE